MSFTQLQTVNFGLGRKGLSTVGFTLIDVSGSNAASRSTGGVHEVGTTTGIYASQITFPNSFSGSILWDTGEGDSTVYAAEEYNSHGEQINFVKNINGGRWKMDNNTKEMIFYKEDNVTVLARFSMYDQNKSSAVSEVFQRLRNDDETNASTLISSIDP